MIRHLAISIIILSTILVLNGCANKKEPDFIGYIFTKGNNKTVVVGTKDKQPPDVIIKKGESKLEVGTKVEVRYKEDGVSDVFPSNAPVTLSEVKVTNEEKEMLKHLFEDMYNKNGQDYYPVILGIEEKTNEWVVTLKEYYFKIDGETYNDATFQISKNGFTITGSN
ncbi:hypothetical protein [Paenibacillus sp. CF384]|uniref:hypothetical protein n=1 Tax=Paenibacillus sp. CF384 TaxID=1884382 RepID=UPI0008954601|nr:hypothetical protein [Paenibacillus sp. CF384]SDW22625.1 hypothetical protein SAMN05518855_1001720 [Paenibacillus sp. CF384]